MVRPAATWGCPRRHEDGPAPVLGMTLLAGPGWPDLGRARVWRVGIGERPARWTGRAGRTGWGAPAYGRAAARGTGAGAAGTTALNAVLSGHGAARPAGQRHPGADGREVVRGHARP